MQLFRQSASRIAAAALRRPLSRTATLSAEDGGYNFELTEEQRVRAFM